MGVRIHGHILNKLDLNVAKSILTLRNAVVHTLYIWVNDKDTKIVVKIDDQEISFTAKELYETSIRAYDSGMIVRGIPQLLVYDDINDRYLMALAFNTKLQFFNLNIIPPSGTTIKYAYQVMEEVVE